MKKILFVAFIAGATLLSCKKNNPKPANTVSINGTTYSTVKIGTQTWTSVNYNGTGGTNHDGSTTNVTNNSTYGKLYTLVEAQDAAKNLPTGWRLPTVTDVNTLLSSVGATGTNYAGVSTDDIATCNKLRSKSDWQDTQGNNSSGFNAYPAGEEYNGTYDELNTGATFWTNSTEGTWAYYCEIINNEPTYHYAAMYRITPITTYRFSIRFVKDN